MISTLTTMWTCRWSARRIQRYLDADPSASLSAEDVRRLETHLATCEKCTAEAEEYRGVRRALEQWARGRTPDPAVVARVHLAAHRLMADDHG